MTFGGRGNNRCSVERNNS